VLVALKRDSSMAYHKILVDNTTCSRRFHITYDDVREKLPRVEVKCQFCDVVIFSAENHPAVSLAREENLVKTSALSEDVISECHFKDKFSTKTVKNATDEDIYKNKSN
jgi:hypothetical protein